MSHEATVELIMTLHESDPLVAILQAELPEHSESVSICRTEVVHYSARGGSHWMSVITTLVTVDGIRWLSTRLREMFANTIHIEVTKDSCSVSGRTPEQINAATEAAVALMKEMQALSATKSARRKSSKKSDR